MQNLFEFTPLVASLIPVTLGLVEVVKRAGLPDRFAPSCSVIVSICLVALTGASIPASFASGFIVGLSASGLYAGTKASLSG